ncbi:MAG: hypothetical protein NC320_03305 [Clostridium sp.]|nr:hypothetical protein [Clostridium sp.]
MDFKTFSVDTTNIFPIANSTKGGQLVTEFNLKSRESAAYYESVKYTCGPSYVHAEEDFYVTALKGGSNFFTDSPDISSSTLQIAPGRGVIDGHFIENLVPMTIDLAEVNGKLQPDQKLEGNLAVGLRIMYSTEQTMAGSILAENKEYFEGIQVVILPVDQFHLPTDVYKENGVDIDCGIYENKNKVTAHILLAAFTYSNSNGIITDIKNNYPEKCQMLPATRIGNINGIISSEYIKGSNLDPEKLYVFAGRGKYENFDTWCNALDSLMIWDKNPCKTETVDEARIIDEAVRSYGGASFIIDGNKVKLWIPHKQLDYDMKDANGNIQRYKPIALELPVADYATGTPGIVDKSYTEEVKYVISKIDTLQTLTNGKQKMYIEELGEDESIAEKVPLNQNWKPGDYILVGKDYTLSNGINEEQGINPPASMYVVLPGKVTEIEPSIVGGGTKPNGVELDRIYKNEVPVVDIHSKDIYNSYWDLTSEISPRGIVNEDYFTYVYTKINDDGSEDKPVYYYYTVSVTDKTQVYSEAIQLTAQIPYASEETVGGFLNVPDSTLDKGYVYLDDTGHLRLLDYELLRSGVLAYQLGEDFTVPAGLSITEIQSYLDEYVNQRVAFPNINHSQTAENPNIIDITLTLSPADDETDEPKEINIYDIDSRFQTAVRLNIFGTADSKVKINISDCSRVIINPSIGGSPEINLYRSCLYYDSSILNTLNIISDMSLWYSKLSDTDPKLIVDGMTVTIAQNAGSFSSDYSISSNEYWSPETPNDNHFKIMLQSITFTSGGYVSGCSVLVNNSSTNNVVLNGKRVIHDKNFELPQGNLKYPQRRFKRPIKVTGHFISCYDSVQGKYNIQETSFSLNTQYYDPESGYQLVKGEIAFLIDSCLIDAENPEIIDVWGTDSYHSFEGTAVY